jgi:CRP-like cAMP-binding protein
MNNALHDRIADHPFFTGIKPDYLKIIVTGASEVAFKPGELIFLENEPANRLFLIESGKINVEAHQPGDGTVPIQTIGAGDVLGWSWLYPPFVWHFQAKALEATTAIVVDGAHLLVAAEKNHSFGFELMRRVAQVLICRLQGARKQLLQQAIESAYDG